LASIEKRGKNTYRLIVELGYDANGKRIRRTKTVKVKTKKEAEKELAKFIVEVESGTYVAPEKMTFANFVENEWLKKYAEKEYSPTTLKLRIYAIKAHIMPYFGQMQLNDIKPIHIVTFLDRIDREKSKTGPNHLSGSTKRNIYSTLKNILSRAYEWKIIPNHPMEGIKLPKGDHKEMKYYSTEEAYEVVKALYQESDTWRLFFLGAMFGGFRRGELLALEWSDVDFDNNTISVRKSIPITIDGKAVIKTPKTKSSERVVVMPEWYMRELKEYYREWKKERLRLGDQWKGGDKQYVFHSGFGEPYSVITPTSQWIRIVKRYGLKRIRLHDLRHTAATLLIEAGVDLKSIQERLGHSNYQVTADIYAHMTQKMNKEAASKLEKFDPIKIHNGPQSVPK
jgi:integrase